MAMDLCEHGDLYDMAKYVHGRRLPLPAVRVWMAQMVCALEHSHKCGLLHRDLKMENILLVPY
jgi:serine/threonine protein kinase